MHFLYCKTAKRIHCTTTHYYCKTAITCLVRGVLVEGVWRLLFDHNSGQGGCGVQGRGGQQQGGLAGGGGGAAGWGRKAGGGGGQTQVKLLLEGARMAHRLAAQVQSHGAKQVCVQVCQTETDVCDSQSDMTHVPESLDQVDIES